MKIMSNANIKNIFVFILFFVIIFCPKISLAEESRGAENGSVSVENATDSIFNKIPKNLYKPFHFGIEWVENHRKNLNIYAENEISKIKNLTNNKKSEVKNGDNIFSNNSLGDSKEVFNQVKYYIFLILAFIASHQLLFWAILFLIFFALARTILRILF